MNNQLLLIGHRVVSTRAPVDDHHVTIILILLWPTGFGRYNKQQSSHVLNVSFVSACFSSVAVTAAVIVVISLAVPVAVPVVITWAVIVSVTAAH